MERFIQLYELYKDYCDDSKKVHRSHGCSHVQPLLCRIAFDQYQNPDGRHTQDRACLGEKPSSSLVYSAELIGLRHSEKRQSYSPSTHT